MQTLLRQALEKTLQKNYPNFSIKKVQPVSGGSINSAYQISDNQQSFIVKTNHANRYPNMFETEQKGIELLSSSNAIKVPKIIEVGTVENESFILMEWIKEGDVENGFWEKLGQQLAVLHKNTTTNFGLNHDNYIGSLPQSNTQHVDWVNFFIQERFQPQLKMANLDKEVNRQFEVLFHQLETIFPNEPPALLHGDLWSGNFMADENNTPVIFDPAVYYGHREMDIAMTKLFGGFSATFYNSYNSAYPMETGWENRLAICNLYPLLVHVNLFGGSYLQQVKSILNKFV